MTDPRTLRYLLKIVDESAGVMPAEASASDRAQQLRDGAGDLPVSYVRSVCSITGSIVVSASRSLSLQEEGAIERHQPEGEGQRVWFEVTGAGPSQAEAQLDALSLLRELGFREEADLISLQESLRA